MGSRTLAYPLPRQTTLFTVLFYCSIADHVPRLNAVFSFITGCKKVIHACVHHVVFQQYKGSNLQGIQFDPQRAISV